MARVADNILNPPALGDCRVCGEPSWLADEEGPVHLCCAGLRPGQRCPACAASKASRARRVAHTVIDQRAIASGKRRSTTAQYRAAQRGEAVQDL